MCLCLFLKEKLLLHFSQTNVLCFLWWLSSFLAVSWISPQSLQINFSPPSPCTASMCLASDPADFKIWLQMSHAHNTITILIFTTSNNFDLLYCGTSLTWICVTIFISPLGRHPSSEILSRDQNLSLKKIKSLAWSMMKDILLKFPLALSIGVFCV